jgi:hypothetical protein
MLKEILGQRGHIVMESLALRHAPATSDDTLFPAEGIARVRAFFRDATGGSDGKTLVVMAYPGSGTTTLINLIIKECGDIDVVWTHPGTVRLRGLLEAARQGSISATGKRKFVVFDAFDAMLTDQATNADILEFLKKSPPMPIVCIAHQRRNALQRAFEAFPSAKRRDQNITTVEFPRLSDEAIYRRVLAIAVSEGIDISEDTLASNVKDARGDLRSALGVLELGIEGSAMDDFPDGLEAAAEALAKDPTIQRALELYHADITVVPAAVFENYSSLAKNISMCADVSDSFSLADTVHEVAFAKQRWDLLDIIGVLSVAAPAMRMNTTMAPAILKFGTVWSKANNRLAKLKALRHVRTKFNGIPIEDVAYIRTVLLAALAQKDAKTIQSITACLGEKDVLAIMRQWKCGYTTNHHIKMKKLMAS